MLCVCHLLVVNSSVWLEVGLSHPHMIQEFVDSNEDCHLKLVEVFNDFTSRSVILFCCSNVTHWLSSECSFFFNPKSRDVRLLNVLYVFWLGLIRGQTNHLVDYF